MSDDRLERILSLHKAAQRLADPDDPWGQRARLALPSETGLSSAGVDHALSHCLEHAVTRSTLSGLVKRQKRYDKSHVLLSANVFSAAFRAIALGLSQSSQTQVRASGRAPTFSRLLHEASGGAFELVSELFPERGEPMWVYGTDETISSIRASLPSGALLHAHGPGLGAAVFIEPIHLHDPELPTTVDALAKDVIAFDQRGCLSPRVVLVQGSRGYAELVCDLLVQSLNRWEERVPRGRLDEQESADALRFEATMTFVGSSVPAGMGMVFLDPTGDRLLIPPVGRYLHVTVCEDALPILVRLGPQLTTVAFDNGGDLPGRLREEIGDRRLVDMGQMQSPAFDGPVDLRHGFEPERL